MGGGESQRRLSFWRVFLGDWYVPLVMAGFQLVKKTVLKATAFRDHGSCPRGRTDGMLESEGRSCNQMVRTSEVKEGT